MPGAEQILVFTIVSGIAGVDLSRTHPLTAAGLFLGALYALVSAAFVGLHIPVPEAMWWVSAIVLPAAFWMVALEIVSRTRQTLGVHVILFGFQTLWFALAVMVFFAAGGEPNLPLAIGLSVIYGLPLVVGLWATGGSAGRRRVESRWQVLALCLATAMMLALTASRPDPGFVLVFFLLAIIWGLIRYGECLEDPLRELGRDREHAFLVLGHGGHDDEAGVLLERDEARDD